MSESFSSFSGSCSPQKQGLDSSASSQPNSGSDNDYEQYYYESVIMKPPLSQKLGNTQYMKDLIFRNTKTRYKFILILKHQLTVTDPYDIIENGYGMYRWHQEYIRIPDKNNINFCQIHKIDGKKTEFIMFNEKNPQFKLYARLIQKEWLFYPFDSNDPQFDETQYLFKMIINNEQSTLWSTECESCSLKFKKFCQNNNENFRQQLMISQIYKEKNKKLPLNLLRANIPRVSYGVQFSDNQSNCSASTQDISNKQIYNCDEDIYREVWCPSTINNISQQYQQDKNKNFTFKEIQNTKTTQKENNILTQRIDTKLPVWSKKDGCWVIDSNGRVQQASKRNIQLNTDQQPQMIYQLGKLSKGIYVVDYRRPLCFVQAMALALQTNQFKSKID